MAPGNDHSADKAEPVWNDGYAHRLVVKFANDQRARQTADGKVDLASGDEDQLASVLRAHRLTVAPILRLDDAKLDAIEQMAAEPTDMRGGSGTLDRESQLAAARALLALDSVEYVYLEPLDVPPPGDIAPMTESYVARQTYSGTDGINAVFAATLGATGAGVRISDVEYGWNYQHEDLVDRNLHPEPGQTINAAVIAAGWDQHGTAAIGETSAVVNSYGCRAGKGLVFTYPG